MPKFGERQLIISDLQIPFVHEKALDFALFVQKEFKIDNDNILCVGDEVDHYFGSLYKKDCNASHTPNSEIAESKRMLKEWFKAFPNMWLAESNHGMRWAKKAADAEIPSQMLRKYQEVLETPETWRWAPQWMIKTPKERYILKHGLDCSGKTPSRQQAEIMSISSVFGHLHSTPCVSYVRTGDKQVWSMCVSCMINRDDYAFAYGKDQRFKPVLTLGVVLDNGRMPILVPYPEASPLSQLE